MKLLMIHCIDEAVSVPPAGADEKDSAEARELDAWVAEMEASGVKLHGGSMDEAIEIASGHPTARIGTSEFRPFWE
jgi:hypothetical protein